MKKYFLVVLIVGLLICTNASAAEWTVGVGDYWGSFNLNYQDYEVKFESEGIGLLGFYTEGRVLDNKLGIGLNYVSGKYIFEGAGTTAEDEEIEASGDRNRVDVDFWVRYAPSRHFSFFIGYKYLTFDFRDIYAEWFAPIEEEGKILEGEADVDMDGLALGFQTAFGRRVIGVISLSYFPALSGTVTWDGFTQYPGEEKEVDTGESTIDAQGLKLQFNVVKPFPSINSALTVGYYLQVVADELDTINYRTDELFTGLMLSFSYTFRFGGPSEVEAEEVMDDTDDLYSSLNRLIQ